MLLSVQNISPFECGLMELISKIDMGSQIGQCRSRNFWLPLGWILCECRDFTNNG